MYKTSDQKREHSPRESISDDDAYRTPWRRDYARLIHSPSFRRLQGKTQLYPGFESDFFRNRLTHSIEVAQIAKSIAIRLNSLSANSDFTIEPDICELAGLAHDIGHPPFGHQGEDALDSCMRNYGGFEGNAQTLRILTKLEKKYALETKSNVDNYRFGLALTYRSLASILKYDRVIPEKRSERKGKGKDHPIKGYYKSEEEIVQRIKAHVVGDEFKGSFKTIECKIMDIADDIAYSTYDLEDGLKAGFFNPIDWLIAQDQIYQNVANKVTKALQKEYKTRGLNYKKQFTVQDVKDTIKNIFDIVFDIKLETSAKNPQIDNDEFKDITVSVATSFQIVAKKLSIDGYFRNMFTSKLIDEFIHGVKFSINSNFPSQSTAYLEEETRIKVEVLKNFTYESQILSPRLKVAEYRGKEIVKEIFCALSTDEGWRLMPHDYQTLFLSFRKKADKYRMICDFISGMTDRYAIEFYGRLKSENPETIFKPF